MSNMGTKQDAGHPPTPGQAPLAPGVKNLGPAFPHFKGRELKAIEKKLRASCRSWFCQEPINSALAGRFCGISRPRALLILAETSFSRAPARVGNPASTAFESAADRLKGGCATLA